MLGVGRTHSYLDIANILQIMLKLTILTRNTQSYSMRNSENLQSLISTRVSTSFSFARFIALQPDDLEQNA